MRTRIVVGSAIAAASWYAFFRVTTWRDRWGRNPDDQAADLPGDDLVATPVAVDTRSLRIAAPPEAVWPWLVQMGFDRAGWYSYDQLDMRGRSADSILPAFQSLAVGDTVPTDPGGGFTVRVLDPGRALVLSADTESMRQRASVPAAGAGAPGLAASGKLLETGVPPEFAASWAFVLRPDGEGGTRLVERFRIWFGEGTGASRLMSPMLGFGVFLMMRKQMLGIRARAERTSAGTLISRSPTSHPTPAPGEG